MRRVARRVEGIWFPDRPSYDSADSPFCLATASSRYGILPFGGSMITRAR